MCKAILDHPVWLLTTFIVWLALTSDKINHNRSNFLESCRQITNCTIRDTGSMSPWSRCWPSHSLLRYILLRQANPSQPKQHFTFLTSCELVKVTRRLLPPKLSLYYKGFQVAGMQRHPCLGVNNTVSQRNLRLNSHWGFWLFLLQTSLLCL